MCLQSVAFAGCLFKRVLPICVFANFDFTVRPRAREEFYIQTPEGRID